MGLTISAVSEVGSVIELRAGPAIDERVARGEVRCDRLIPDEESVEEMIALDALGTVERIRMEVSIQHTYVGDLRVELVASSGKTEKCALPKPKISVSPVRG